RCGEGEDRRHRAQRLRRATATRRALRNRRFARSRRRLRDQGVSLLARNRGRAENAAEPRRGRWRRRARISGRRPVRRRARAAMGFLEEHRAADLPRWGCRPASLSGWQRLAEGRSEAAEKGITINVIACFGLSAEGERVFERIAKMSDGTMTHLTYTR